MDGWLGAGVKAEAGGLTKNAPPAFGRWRGIKQRRIKFYCAVTLTMKTVEVAEPDSGVPVTATRYSPMAASRATLTRNGTWGLSLARTSLEPGVTLMPSVLSTRRTFCLK